MNMDARAYGQGETIRELLTDAHHEMKGDLVGLWSIVSHGRVVYRLEGGDLREFVLLYVATLIAHGGIVIDGARDGIRYHKRTDRYGTKAVEVAEAVVREWIAQGEPDPPSYEGIAFTLPDYLESEDNLRANNPFSGWPVPER
jgi:hypothetical protein